MNIDLEHDCIRVETCHCRQDGTPIDAFVDLSGETVSDRDGGLVIPVENGDTLEDTIKRFVKQIQSSERE